ncbi:dnaJ homolog subfamily C member 4 isoform X3 [Erinaceus europaeus]|uniref:DnaJ homolog subfamily C member 4 isoform X3 n=1 Tax=Erinaceus europaeus TaxID=9365 RepID=A0ABM3W6E3_ERIEU|nr:dnaJ homolog subfamily C member 4 isoform X3 [Erinaceus europaeus]
MRSSCGLSPAARPPPCRPAGPCTCARAGPAAPPPGSSQRPPGSGLGPATTMSYWGCILVPAWKKLNGPSSPSPRSRFVELSEAYQVLSHEQSRRTYDQQLHWAPQGPPPPPPGAQASPGAAASHSQTHSSWEPPNARYWAQFHRVWPQEPEFRRQQHKHNQRVLGYCVFIMLAGMGLHYAAFRKLEQMHRSFMDEKDRIITTIYKETRARAKDKRARFQQDQARSQRLQPGPGVAPPGTSS